MIKTFEGNTPSVAETAWVAETALVMGDVALGEWVGVWPGAVIRGDFARIEIGAGTIIEDNVVVHSGQHLTLGTDVIVGHGAVVHCREIGANTMIANNATALDDAVIGSFCILGAGCVVSPGTVVPDRSLVFGTPGKVVGEVKPHQMERLNRGNASYRPMFDAYRRDGI